MWKSFDLLVWLGVGLLFAIPGLRCGKSVGQIFSIAAVIVFIYFGWRLFHPDHVADAATGKSPDFGGQHPTQLATRIAASDRIVVTSYFALIDKEHRDMRFIITGTAVKKIIRAVSDAGRLPVQVDNIPSWTLEFYRGTNALDSISFESYIFNYGGEHYEQYSDKSKVLENLDAELTERVK